MITMRIKGGLGNQLFQYAAAYSMAKRLGQDFRFNPAFSANMTARGYRLDKLKVDVNTVAYDSELPKWVSIRKNVYINKLSRVLGLSKMKLGDTLYWLETKDEWQPDFFLLNEKNIYIDGYFQSADYFAEFRSELIEQIQPNYELETEYLRVLEEIKSTHSVAVHVRRSDFKKDKHPFHYLLDQDYYKQAIRYMRNNVEYPTFYWFSDDIEWVKNALGDCSDYVFVRTGTTYGDIDDLMLMKNCEHIITANSTFSWWAAWLNEHQNAIRIVPQKPYGIKEMIPREWIIM